MPHVGKEPNKGPRIAFDISPKLKKALDDYIKKSGRSVKWTGTILFEKLLSGEIKL